MKFISNILTALVAVQSAQAVRTLKAARHVSELAKRDIAVPLSKTLKLSYSEEYQHGSAEYTCAHLELESKGHMLALEQIEHLLDEVHCERGGNIHLRFLQPHFAMARDALDIEPGLLVITSHHGCNQPGERIPYRVKNVSIHEHKNTLSLEVGPANWQDDFASSVRFGPANAADYSFNNHYDLRKREDDDSDSTASASETAAPTIDFPTASGKPTATAVADNISKALKGVKILPPSTGDISINRNTLPAGLSVTCKECSIDGSVHIQHGYFKVGDHGAIDFFQDGFVSVVANKFKSVVSLESAMAPSFPSIDVALPSIPLSPFAIPGVASVGVVFSPVIEFAVAAADNTTINYGFKLSVPDNSTSVIAIGDASNSTSNGFKDTTVDSLPFTADIGQLSLTMSVALKPRLQLGIKFATKFIGAEMFLDLPKLALSIRNVNHTDANCNSKNGTGAPPPNVLTPLFGDLVLFEPTVSLDVGFDVNVLGEAGAAFTPLATQFALPTACYAFDKSKGSMVPAALAASSVAAKAAASSKNAAAGLRVGGEGAVGGGWCLMALALSFVAGVLTVL